MDYEKKYKQLHKFISDLYPFMSEYCKEKVEGFLPEFKESEDEKIRKFLIKWIQDNYYHGTTEIPTKTLIAWLEKQGSEPNWCHHKVDLSNCSEEYRKAYYDGWNNCNQQHSQCKSEWNDVVKCLINGMKFYYEDNEEATWGTEKFPMKVKDILSWLEKQGREKPADNVESKFKVGDWITDDEDEAIFHITSYDIDYGYQLETVNGTSFHYSDETIEKKYRLWTIQDAKDGDVLVDEDNNIGIYKGIEYIWWKSYIYLGCDNRLYGFSIGGSHKQNGAKPATKEQRDLLFQKMKEAGYEWDAEKKELKKFDFSKPIKYNSNPPSIVKEPAWTEDDENILNDMKDTIKECWNGDTRDILLDWFETIKQRIKGE